MYASSRDGSLETLLFSLSVVFQRKKKNPHTEAHIWPLSFFTRTHTHTIVSPSD